MYHLVCVVPFHGYEKGQAVTDPTEVANLLAADRGQHFVKVPDTTFPKAEQSAPAAE